MKKQLVNILKFVLFFGLGVFLVYWSLKDIQPKQWDSIWHSLGTANYWWLLISMMLAISSHVSRAMRWRMMLQSMDYQPSTKNTFFAVMIGYLANLAVPRLGEITRCGVLYRYDKIPVNKSLGSVVTERAIDMVMLLLVFALALIIQYDVLIDKTMGLFEGSEESGGFLSYLKYIIAGLVAIAVALLLIFRKRLRQFTLFARIIDFIRGLFEGLRSVTRVKNPFAFIGHTIFIWFAYLSMIWVCFYSMDATSHLGFNAALAILAFGSIAMIITPGGIGLYPVIVSGLLALKAFGPNPEAAVEYGVDPDTDGTAFGWLIWTGQTLMLIVLGFLSLLLINLTNKTTPKPAADGANG